MPAQGARQGAKAQSAGPNGASTLGTPGSAAGLHDNIWDAVLPRTPPPPTPSALPGMFCNEQYTAEQKHALFVFRYLLVFVAALESFAHGANDTGNATGVTPCCQLAASVWFAWDCAAGRHTQLRCRCQAGARA